MPALPPRRAEPAPAVAPDALDALDALVSNRVLRASHFASRARQLAIGAANRPKATAYDSLALDDGLDDLVSYQDDRAEEDVENVLNELENG
jgi:hypothetical protein